MSTRAGLRTALALSFLALVGGASAQPPSAGGGEPELGAEPEADADTDADTDTEAKRLYAEGKGEYAQGRYVEAIALFERAYAASGAPALLFNMAQAHRLAGDEHCPQASALYKSYLAALPQAENRREVQERVQELGECAIEPAPLPRAPATPAPAPIAPAPSQALESSPAFESSPAPRSATQGPRRGPALVAGVGAALLITGSVLYAKALAKHREAERVCPCYPGAYSKWELLTNVSYAALGVGGAALAGGISWWVFGTPASSAAPAQAAIGVSGRF